MASWRWVMAFSYEDRLLAHHIVGLGQVDERAFGVPPVEVDRAFQDELGLGRHQQVDGFGPHHLQRLQRIGDLQLVHADLDRGGRRRQHVGRVADADGHIHLFQVAAERYRSGAPRTTRTAISVLENCMQRWKSTFCP